MPIRPNDPEHASDAASRAAQAAVRAEARLADAIDDLFLPDGSRLDDRVRVSVGGMLADVVAAVETDLRRDAARILADAGEPARAQAIAGQGDAFARLARAGLLRDAALIDELLARVRMDLIAGALPVQPLAPEGPGRLVRLAAAADPRVAEAARGLLAAHARRRAVRADPAGLPAAIRRRLVWLVAAALRGGDDPHRDRAIAQAALCNLAAQDAGDRPEAAAMRLAAAIDAPCDQLAPLLVDAIDDRNLLLFAALLAHALAIDHDQLRAMVIEPEGERLWLALRAVALDRAAIARIALALSQADPRRDVEAFADRLDAIAAVPADEATAALAPFALQGEFRAAVAALARSEWR